ncbi:MAG: hypothetical protein LQ340_004585 [Diploschistes diacapsis]|nr:MAG: hypothetical protein LQ340_004585 [Diploschistes diacapsis]
MGILLIGASGRTGSLVLTEALSRGRSVTALVRDPTPVSFLSASQRQSLTIVQGTPLSPADVDRAFSSAPPTDRISSIIVTLSARRASDSPFAKPVSPPRLLADCHANLVAAMKTHPEVKKIVTMSAFGVGDSFVELPWAFRLLFRKSSMAAQFADHDATDREVKATGSVSCW